MPKRADHPPEVTSVRVRRKTANIISMIAKAKNKTADEVVWDMLEQLYAREIGMYDQMFGDSAPPQEPPKEP